MIYVDWKPDKKLVSIVTGVPKRRTTHDFKGKYGVCKRISGARNRKAVVDEDPGKVHPPYLSRYNHPNDPGRLHKVINADHRKIERLLEDVHDTGSNKIRALAQLLR